MAWVDVTTLFSFGPNSQKISRHAVNSDQIVRIADQEDGSSVLFFNVVKDNTQLTLHVRESMDAIVQQIRNREAVLASSA